MKKILLILMTLVVASVAGAHPRSDTVLKDLIAAGTWSLDTCRHGKEYTYYQDGTLRIEIEGSAKMKWDIKDGELIEIDTPGTEGIDPTKWEGKGCGYLYVYTILFLTKHELLVQDQKDKTYRFMYR